MSANLIHGSAVERQFGLFVGGYMPIAVNDEQLLDATDAAVNKINFEYKEKLGLELNFLKCWFS